MEWNQLPYDSARRFAAIAAILARLEPAAGARVLDVGGHPGTLARLLRPLFPTAEILTVDRVEADLEHYRHADGTALPFAEASFDIVVSSDVLEHVSPAERRAFVAELCRVARAFVVLGAPFHHPAVEAIEAQLNAFHAARLGADHPWLGEHVAHGLPRLPETLALFPRGREQAVFRHAPLGDWTAWQWGALAAKLDMRLDEAWGAAGAQWSDALAAWFEAAHRGDFGDELQLVREGEPAAFLPYRHLIVSQPADRAPFPAPPAEWDPAQEPGGEAALALSRLMQGLVEAACETCGAPQQLAPAIDERLRQALQLAEAENARLRGGERHSGGFLERLLGRRES